MCSPDFEIDPLGVWWLRVHNAKPCCIIQMFLLHNPQTPFTLSAKNRPNKQRVTFNIDLVPEVMHCQPELLDLVSLWLSTVIYSRARHALKLLVCKMRQDGLIVPSSCLDGNTRRWCVYQGSRWISEWYNTDKFRHIMRNRMALRVKRSLR